MKLSLLLALAVLHLAPPAGEAAEQQDRRGYQRQFENAFRFAAKYAGLHASPEVSPGAWIAFRENHVVLSKNVPSLQARQLSFFTGDYNFLMNRLPDENEGLHNVGPENQRQGAWARLLAPGGKMELKLDARFAASFRSGTAAVCYLDRAEDAGGTFRIVAGQSPTNVPQKGTGRWETAELVLPGGPLAARPSGAHLAIVAGEKPVCLHMVEVSRR